MRRSPRSILLEAGLLCEVCIDLPNLMQRIRDGADVAILTEESVGTADTRALNGWVETQPPWSDFPFIVLTGHGGTWPAIPPLALLTEVLGNVTFLERPFHPTTLISVV